jgi:hypothetical protein
MHQRPGGLLVALRRLGRRLALFAVSALLPAALAVRSAQAQATPPSSSVPNLPLAGLTLRVPGDSFALKPLVRFGVLVDGFPYRAAPGRVAEHLVAASRRRAERLAAARWRSVIQAPLLARPAVDVGAIARAPGQRSDPEPRAAVPSAGGARMPDADRRRRLPPTRRTWGSTPTRLESKPRAPATFAAPRS